MKSKNSRPVYHDNAEDPIPENIYPVIDTDFARDNIENDLTAADLQDLTDPHQNDNVR